MKQNIIILGILVFLLSILACSNNEEAGITTTGNNGVVAGTVNYESIEQQLNDKNLKVKALDVKLYSQSSKTLVSLAKNLLPTHLYL